ALRTRTRGFTSGSQNGPPQLPPMRQLKPSTSIPELASFRRNFINSTYRPERGPAARYTNSSVRSKDVPIPWTQDETRASYRSALMHDDPSRASFRSAFTNG